MNLFLSSLKQKLAKISQKLIDIGYQFIPHKYYLRPKGIIKPSSAELNQNDIQYRLVFEEYESFLTYPRSLYDAMLKKNYDRVIGQENPTLIAEKTAAYLLIIPQGRIYTDNSTTISIISKLDMLISSVSFQYKRGKTVHPNSSKIFALRYFREPVHYKGIVFVMLSGGGSANGNYYHWIIDVLPRLYLLQQSGYLEKVSKFLVPQYCYSFQKETMHLFGIAQEKIIEAKSHLHITADHLLVSSHPRGERSFLVPDWIFDFFQNQFPEPATSFAGATHFYVSRADSSKRKVSNEGEVISLLEQYGIRAYKLSELSFANQIALFRQAKLIISPHGAGLTNILFCKSQPTVLELYSEGYVHSYFYNLAAKLGISYQYLIFSHKNAAYREKKGQLEDITVNLPVLEKSLSTLLGGRMI